MYTCNDQIFSKKQVMSSLHLMMVTVHKQFKYSIEQDMESVILITMFSVVLDHSIPLAI